MEVGDGWPVDPVASSPHLKSNSHYTATGLFVIYVCFIHVGAAYLFDT